MKKTLLLSFALILQVILFAQPTYRNTISLQSGASLFGPLRLAKFSPTNDVSYTGGKISVIPTLQGAFDYNVNKWLSVGVAAAHNSAKLSFDDVKYKGQVIGSADTKIARTSLTGRILFHYSKNEKFDMYSGLRGGFSFWSGTITGNLNDEAVSDLLNTVGDISVPDFIKNKVTNGTTLRSGFAFVQLQIIPFGIRYYITDNIGVSAETGLGAPYYFALGAHTRF